MPGCLAVLEELIQAAGCWPQLLGGLVEIVLMSWGSFHAEFRRQVHHVSYNKLKDLSKEVSGARKARYADSHSRRAELVEHGFSDEELRRFMSYVRDEEAKCAFMLMATLGLRVGELLGLRGGDVQGGRLRMKAAKGSYDAFLKLPGAVMHCLEARKHGDQPIFAMHRKTLQDRFAAARREAGMDDVYLITKPCGPNRTRNRRYRLSIHSLRHYAIQRFYKLTQDPDLTRAFARHRDMKSTQVYMQKDRVQAVEMALENMIQREMALEVLS